MTVISKIMINSTTGKYQISMPSGGQFQFFDFFNDSPYQVSVVFGQDTGESSSDIILLPNTIEEGVQPPASNSQTVGGLWTSAPLFIYVDLPVGGNVLASQAPAQQLTVLGHSQGFKYGKLTTLSRFQGVSNPSLNTNGGNVASSIVNDGNIPTSPVIEATASGDTQSAVRLDNVGNLVLGDTLHPGSLSIANGTYKVDGAGNETSANLLSGSLKFINTTGIYRLIASLNQFNNNNTLFTNADNGRLDINDENGNFMGGWVDGGSFSIANFLEIFQSPSTVNGTTGGTVAIYTPINGTALKVVYMQFNLYNNTTSTRQVFTLPSFVSSAFVFVSGVTNPMTSGVYFQQNGVIINTSTAKIGAASGVVGGTGRVPSFSVGEVHNPFNQVAVDGVLSGTASGCILLIGV